MPYVHSVPVQRQPAACETAGREPPAHLRPYVLGYGGFRSGVDVPVRHRVLPLTFATLVVDVTGASRVVTGPRSTPLVYRRTAWRHGVTVGLTPAGVQRLFRIEPRELADGSFALADVLGRFEIELAERVAAANGWPARFAVLDRWLTGRLTDGRAGGPATGPASGRAGDALVHRAWARLEESAGRLRIGALAAELRVSRRGLEYAFRRQLGLSPWTVARVARLQRALGDRPPSTDLARVAAEAGYADQAHFTREVRAMTGLTPTELCAYVQDPAAAHR
jgi:AraC-like DNA-binding protein